MRAADPLSLRLTVEVMAVAADRDYLATTRQALQASGVVAAVERHDTAALLTWLLAAVSYQGISDAAATGYMRQHGTADMAQVARSLANSPDCPKLASYWSFARCGFHKGSRTCAEPEHIDACPLPQLSLRNGRLHQSAYALALFARDIADNDLGGWIDRQLYLARGQYDEVDGASSANDETDHDHDHRLREALLAPLSGITGLSRKVLSMALADLLLSIGAARPNWLVAGLGMVAVDSLVHNWLHRTGIAAREGRPHLYGPACTAPEGCEAIIRRLAYGIDARTFNPAFPAHFPRFVQHAIWRFCADSGLGVCNANRIDDTRGCDRHDCPAGVDCDRRPLVAG